MDLAHAAGELTRAARCGAHRHNARPAPSRAGFVIVRPMQTNPDPERLLGDVIRFGVVDSVDYEAKRCVVRITEDLKTGPIRWLAGRAGDVSIGSPPSVGEQGLLFCPEGDIAAAVFAPGLSSDAHPLPGAGRVTHIDLPDGASLVFDSDSHQTTLTLAGGGKLVIVAPSGTTITGDVAIAGKLVVSGDVDFGGAFHLDGDMTGEGDIKAGAISLLNHRTSGVQTGSGTSAGPVA